VVYLYFDRLAQHMKPKEAHAGHEQQPVHAD
jgi:hypothetical protein